MPSVKEPYIASALTGPDTVLQPPLTVEKTGSVVWLWKWVYYTASALAIL